MKREPSLRSFLIRGSLVLVLIPLVVVGLVGGQIVFRSVEQSITASNKLLARAVAGRLNEFFARAEDALLMARYGALDRMQAARRDPNLLTNHLKEILRLYPFIGSIEICDLSGRIKQMEPRAEQVIGTTHHGEDFFSTVIDAEGRFAWSPTYISTKTGLPALSYGMVAGENLVLLMEIELEKIKYFAERVVGEYGGQIQLRIIGEYGYYIYHPNSRIVQEREHATSFRSYYQMAKNGTFFQRSEESGENYLIAGITLQEPSWLILVMSPEKVVYSEIYNLLALFSLVLALSAFLGIAYSIWRARSIFRPIRTFSDRALAIGRGEFEALSSQGFREFRILGANFNLMVDAIRDRERALREREREFRQVLESVNLLVLMVNRAGIVLFANDQVVVSTGYGRDFLVGSYLNEHLFQGKEQFPASLAVFLESPVSQASLICAVKTSDGNVREIEWSAAINSSCEGNIEGLTLVGVDLTERIQHARAIEEALSEKEVLLREVHHRVKNNLQIITSFLSLQEMRLGVTESRLPLIDAQNRIRSLALVHENLYQSDNFRSINLEKYITQLASSLYAQSGATTAMLEFDILPVSVTMQDAIPCGLIVNEAVTNAIKYACLVKEGVLLHVSVSPHPGGKARICVRDTGPGLPENYKPEETTTLGHTVMQLLAKQLEGRISIRSDGGTVVELTF